MEVLSLESNDGSWKYRFPVERNLQIEAAFFRVSDRDLPNIACVSTQLGCAVKCPFCATAKSPFFRNLTKEEILFEIDYILNDRCAEQLLNEGFEISFMGAGEPLANLRTLLMVLSEIKVRYSQINRVAISTAGPASRIEALTRAMPTPISVHLQLSLHATVDKIRRRLVPNAPDSIDNLLRAAQRFYRKTGDRVCLNYILFKGLNDSTHDANWLAKIDRDAFYVKLTALNEAGDVDQRLEGATIDEIRSFSRLLDRYQLSNKIFVGDGLDVDASCGQLAAVPRELRG